MLCCKVLVPAWAGIALFFATLMIVNEQGADAATTYGYCQWHLAKLMTKLCNNCFTFLETKNVQDRDIIIPTIAEECCIGSCSYSYLISYCCDVADLVEYKNADAHTEDKLLEDLKHIESAKDHSRLSHGDLP